MNNSNDDLALNNDLNLLELLNSLWKDKFKILLITTLFSIFSIFYALSLPNYYESKALLSISNSNEESNLMSSLSSTYGGLASMAGIRIPGQASGNRAALAEELLKSRSFVKHLIEVDPYITRNLIAVKSYNFNKNFFEYDDKIYITEKDKWIIEKPTYLDVHDIYLSKVLSVYKNIETGYLTVSVEHLSPVYAKNLLTLIIDELNDIVRSQDLIQSTNSLIFLEEKARDASINKIKLSINEIIESQLKTQMLAAINKDYLLKKIDPPFIPEKKSSPRRGFLCIVITCFGFLIGILFSITKNFIYRK